MPEINNKKICIVVSSLGKGGAERSSALLSKMLYKLGHEVHIVSVLNQIDYEYKGTLLNLGELKDKNDTIFGRIKRLLIFKAYLKQHKFDVIIDNRSRSQAFREFIITTFIYNTKTIYVIHNFETSKSFTKYNWLNKFLYKNKIMTSVSYEAQKKFKNLFKLNNIHTINNGFDFNIISTQSQEKITISIDNYIIFFGRIYDEHKNLKLLLRAYKKSELPKQQIKLLILGDGPDYKAIVEYSFELQINDFVIFKEFIPNPYPYVRKALFTLLTSRFEGFPMIIPESLSLGVPVISVDCQSGPNEIIKNGYNGLLVENFNEQALAEAMNSFIFDKNLYQICKNNAQKSVEKFSVEKISKEWKSLINELI